MYEMYMQIVMGSRMGFSLNSENMISYELRQMSIHKAISTNAYTQITHTF